MHAELEQAARQDGCRGLPGGAVRGVQHEDRAHVQEIVEIEQRLDTAVSTELEGPGQTAVELVQAVAVLRRGRDQLE